MLNIALGVSSVVNSLFSSVPHFLTGLFGSLESNSFTKFTGKWIDLENIILSKVAQSQKNTHGIYSLIS